MKKVMLLIMILIAIMGCSNENYKDSDIQLDKTQAEIEKEALYSELFGDENNKIISSYFDNEKGIRRFVLDFNNKYENKITKVDWKNNHSKAFIYFEEKYIVIYDNDNHYMFDIDFDKGKTMLPEYTKIMFDLSKNIDDTIDDESFNNAFVEAEESKEIVDISDKVNIEINYRKDALSYKSADSYSIKIVGIKYS